MADRSKLGMEFPPYVIKVEKSKIAEFAAAVAQKEMLEDINPLYRDEKAAQKAGYPGIIGPLTLPTIFMHWTGGGLAGTVELLGMSLSRLLHNEEEFEFFGMICAGDVITRKTKVVAMYERGRRDRIGRFVDVTVLETEMTNQRGELVVRVRTTLIERP